MRMPTRAALSAYAGPTPLPVVPMRRAPSLDSRGAVERRVVRHDQVRVLGDVEVAVEGDAALHERLHLLDQRGGVDHDAAADHAAAARVQDARTGSSAARTSRGPRPRCARRCCRPGSGRPRPRAGARTSTTLPLPSSPHCAPTTTMLGMSAASRAPGKYRAGSASSVGHRRRCARRRPARSSTRTSLGVRRAGLADRPAPSARAAGARTRATPRARG